MGAKEARLEPQPMRAWIEAPTRIDGGCGKPEEFAKSVPGLCICTCLPRSAGCGAPPVRRRRHHG
eukprot:CAMPEP_0179106980 /NCGR_PEP_ID=MMETSP0796-20121207/49771_1 /TAXON_ID=73915 /ORGANISM="Pyrodinium bahamense, Strain pbaha01" /LENGTH=64 /DNA_ID=CAMNT_0020805031 /DNA_START=173 /DNA_END=364 /DNA_ORIENTATION=+